MHLTIFHENQQRFLLHFVGITYLKASSNTAQRQVFLLLLSSVLEVAHLQSLHVDPLPPLTDLQWSVYHG